MTSEMSDVLTTLLMVYQLCECHVRGACTHISRDWLGVYQLCECHVRGACTCISRFGK